MFSSRGWLNEVKDAKKEKVCFSMASKKRSYDDEGKEGLENLKVENTFDNEECEKESESESQNKPCKT